MRPTQNMMIVIEAVVENAVDDKAPKFSLRGGTKISLVTENEFVSVESQSQIVAFGVVLRDTVHLSRVQDF